MRLRAAHKRAASLMFGGVVTFLWSFCRLQTLSTPFIYTLIL
jgi:hypothetical protein